MVPKVKDKMTTHPMYLKPEVPVIIAAQKMARENIGSLFIMKEDEVIGIVTETDLVRRCMAAGLDPTVTPVEKIMSAPVLMIDSESALVDANAQMEKNHIRHLGVTERGMFIGVLSVRDLLHPIRVDKRE